MRNYKLEKLQNGETFITSEKGNSMVPLIHSGQEHKLSPASVEDVKVNGKFYTHLVKAVDVNKGCLIGNNRGRINGWTKNVYGKVVEVL